jgi:hypothetical protein
MLRAERVCAQHDAPGVHPVCCAHSDSQRSVDKAFLMRHKVRMGRISGRHVWRLVTAKRRFLVCPEGRRDSCTQVFQRPAMHCALSRASLLVSVVVFLMEC